MSLAVDRANADSRLGPTAALARFVARTSWDDIPDRAIHELKRAILNGFATAFAGSREETILIALESLSEFSDRRQATIIGHRARLDTLSAAFLNAAAANIFDFCDTHLATVIHPTAPVFPALFALAERQQVTGRDLLAAFAVGYEIECRIGLAVSPGHYRRGWHITSTCGVFGAAAAASNALRLDEQHAVWALGNAAVQACGLCEGLGTPAKSISVGNAARNGLWSALLAQKGFSGPPRPIEGTQAFINAFGEASDVGALTRGIGDSWEVLHNACKPYPCGIVIHPVLDGVLELCASEPISPNSVEHVILRGHPLLRQRTDRPDIVTGREAQVSVQHAVAVALLSGSVGVDDFTDQRVNEPAVQALRKRIKVVDDLNIAPEGAVVEILQAGGKERTITIDFARGSAQRPMSDSALEEKLKALATPHVGSENVSSLVDALWQLDQCEDAAQLLAFTSPSG